MLDSARIDLTLPVVDLERARRFYGETLGLKELEMDPDAVSMMALFEAGEGTQLALYLRETPTIADHTAASFRLKGIEKAVDELTARGVVFEQYAMPGLETDERGIATAGPFKSAWFKDTEGNIIAVSE